MLRTVFAAVTAAAWCASAYAAPLQIPQRITVEAMAHRLRTTFQQKMRDVNRNFGREESIPGFEYTFYDRPKSTGGVPVAVSRLQSHLTSDLSERREKVVVTRKDGRAVYSEEIFTRGRGLKPSDINAKLLLADQPGAEPGSEFALTDSDDYKLVTISIDGREFYRITSSRENLSNGVRITSIVHILGKRTLTFIDKTFPTESRREFTLTRHSASLYFYAFGHGWGSGRDTDVTLNVLVRQPKSFVAQDSLYEKDNEQIGGLEAFLAEYDAAAGQGLVLGFLSAILETVASQHFVKTQALKSLGVQDPFLADFIRLRSDSRRAQTDSSVLDQLFRRINQYVLALEEGTVTMSGKVPGSK